MINFLEIHPIPLWNKIFLGASGLAILHLFLLIVGFIRDLLNPWDSTLVPLGILYRRRLQEMFGIPTDITDPGLMTSYMCSAPRRWLAAKAYSTSTEKLIQHDFNNRPDDDQVTDAGSMDQGHLDSCFYDSDEETVKSIPRRPESNLSSVDSTDDSLYWVKPIRTSAFRDLLVQSWLEEDYSVTSECFGNIERAPDSVTLSDIASVNSSEYFTCEE